MINTGRLFALRCISSNVKPQFVHKSARCISTTIAQFAPPEFNKHKNASISKKFAFNSILQRFKGSISGKIMQESINTLQVKKRPIKKRRQEAEAGYYG